MPHYDLVIIGSGAGNSIPGPEFDDWTIAIVEGGTFGGTCLNVGCIPSKMFEYPAEVADGIRSAGPLGVHGRVDRVDWPAIRDRIFGRIDPISAGGKRYREGDECPNITVLTGRGRFTGMKQLHVDLADGSEADVTADRYVIAAGSHAIVPDIPGLDTVTYHTSDSVMRIDALPERVVVLGGGFVAAEFGHVFASFGCAVTQIARGDRLLRHHDDDIALSFTEAVAARCDVRLRSHVTAVRPGTSGGDSVQVDIAGPDGATCVDADLFLIATGREPNGAALQVAATGVELDGAGYVVVDEFQQTSVPGIYAAGDVSSHFQLRHVANAEARIVAHNLRHPDNPRKSDHRFVPAAVFSQPQIAAVGLTERDAQRAGVAYVTARQDYAGIAAGWAREDTTGYCKVLADPESGQLLGVHIVGPEAATIIQPAMTAMQFGIGAHELARGQYWIHPALPELLENALLALPAPTGKAT